MYASENIGGSCDSGNHAPGRASCSGPQRGERFDRFDAVGDGDGDAFRQWAVVAVVLHAGAVALLPIGVVMAADLALAADQVCARLPAPTAVVGTPYLVASPCTPEVRAGDVAGARLLSWVNRPHWCGSWTSTEWVPASGGLRVLDPESWRASGQQ
ncbi:hypothetical protein [Nocardia sp. NPDC057668]|uniref:hypothetical protein n=1 Tax=Nocardia sp. NPDC057668 TaxID=3346202 RepID=UPI0036719996